MQGRTVSKSYLWKKTHTVNGGSRYSWTSVATFGFPPISLPQPPQIKSFAGAKEDEVNNQPKSSARLKHVLVDINSLQKLSMKSLSESKAFDRPLGGSVRPKINPKTLLCARRQVRSSQIHTHPPSKITLFSTSLWLFSFGTFSRSLTPILFSLQHSLFLPSLICPPPHFTYNDLSAIVMYVNVKLQTRSVNNFWGCAYRGVTLGWLQ